MNRIYQTRIRPAVDAEGGICIRADEEFVGGIIHKPTFSRLLHSELVIADLTTANPNVLYEVGIRHAARSRPTRSVDRRGVLRTEVRQALEKWKEMLEDDIYLIPIRLEPHAIPEEMAGFQALDVFAPDWWDRLARAIKAGMEKRPSGKKDLS